MNPRLFHDHLDLCPHCASHPFDLCDVGVRLLGESVSCATGCHGSDPDCPVHGVAAFNARQNEFYRRHPRGQ